MRGELEIKSVPDRRKLTPSERKLEDDELGEKSPDLDVLDRQIDLARTAMVQTEVQAPSGGRVLEVMAHAGEVSSGPFWHWARSRRWWRSPRCSRPTFPGSRSAIRQWFRCSTKRWPASVTRLARWSRRNQLTSMDPRALQDRRVVKVTIGLNDSRPGRQARQHGGGGRRSRPAQADRSRSRSHGHVCSRPPMNHSANVTEQAPAPAPLPLPGCDTAHATAGPP